MTIDTNQYLFLYMQKLDTKLMTSILNKLNITTDVKWNLSPIEIEKICIEEGTAKKTNLGAISVDTGKFTGRAPKDRYIVEDSETKEKIWWGNIKNRDSYYAWKRKNANYR